MHAASVGSAPVFRVVYHTIASALADGDQEVGETSTIRRNFRVA